MKKVRGIGTSGRGTGGRGSKTLYLPILTFTLFLAFCDGILILKQNWSADEDTLFVRLSAFGEGSSAPPGRERSEVRVPDRLCPANFQQPSGLANGAG